MKTDKNAPILVGVGQLTYRDQEQPERTPVDALHASCELALQDSGKPSALRDTIDTVVTEPSLMEAYPETAALIPSLPGPELAARLGCPRATCYKAAEGGNGPQFLINHFAGALHRGEHRAVLICGGELAASLRTLLTKGRDLSHWGQVRDGETLQPWANREGATDTERAHSLWLPVHMYPVFENALRHHHGRSADQHQQHLGKLMQRLSDVAVENPHAWSYHRPRSAAQISSPSERNYFLGFPYTKYMCAQMNVDMAAAVVLTTVDAAQKMGIERERWVYLNGCSDITDVWYVSERPSFHRSEALELAASLALGRAGRNIEDMQWLDLYSCFPSAVEMACEALGVDPFGTRELTVTGGLPYFGGPGNSYTLHAVASMVERLRERPHSHGLITANGWYMTKQSVGVYSTDPVDGDWQRGDDAVPQARLDQTDHPTVDPAPDGMGIVETYTVICGQNGPEKGVVMGRLTNGKRFIAHTPDDQSTLTTLMTEDIIGRRGRVRPARPTNRFEFNQAS